MEPHIICHLIYPLNQILSSYLKLPVITTEENGGFIRSHPGISVLWMKGEKVEVLTGHCLTVSSDPVNLDQSSARFPSDV